MYSSDTYVGGTTSPAIVGAFQGRTGVCAITPDWAINNGGTSGAESLDFGIGTNSLVTGRDFSDAQLVLEEESGSKLQVELVESLGGTQVATQLCNFGSNTTITADTSAPSGGACTPNTGTTGGSFDTVEVRVLTVNSEVSVVGPTSTFTLGGAPALSVTKTFSTNNPGNATTYSQVGQVITYGFSVKNTGTVALNTVTLTDPTLASFAVTCGGNLAPNTSETCTGTGNTHTVTQPDLDAGSVSNTVTATATSSSGAPTPATSTVVASAAQSAALSVTKTFSTNNPGNAATYSQVGQVITYGFSVKNTGNVTLNTVTLTDPALTSFAVTCAPNLAPSLSETCTGTGNTYTIAQTDLNNGSVSNTVTAKATSPAGAPTAATSTTVTKAAQSASLSVTKTFTTNNTDPTTYSLAGQVITYGFSVKNTGNVTLNTVTLTDPTLTSFAVTCGPNLAPNTSETCTGTGNTYTIVQTDLDHGSVSNTVTAKATSSAGAPTPATSTVVTNAAQSAALTVTKTFSTNNPGDATTYSHVSQVITYGFSVKNTGNVTLNTVTLTDPTLSSFAVTCGGNLAPNTSETCTGTGNTYTIAQSDLDNGSVSNTVTAKATSSAGAPTATSTVVTNAVQSPQLMLVKTDNLDGATYTAPGQIITYTVMATNSGNITLHNVMVSDSPTLDGYSCGTFVQGANLAPGASVTCMGSHTVTLDDLSNGSITDTASATSTETGGTTNPVTAGDTDQANETQICGGNTISTSGSDGANTDGTVTASIHLVSVPNTADCKNYSYFNASATATTGGDQVDQVTFLSQQATGAHVTATFVWGNVALCDPNSWGT